MKESTVRKQLLSLMLLAPVLAACESSMRLPPFAGSERITPSAAQPRIDPTPNPTVEAAPLPPPVQSQALPPPPGVAAEPQTAPYGAGTTPGSATSPTTSPQVATAEPPKPASSPEDNAPATRNSVTGNWQAREASGGACKVTLSSVSKLDLYGASTSGCQSKDLQRVTAWELRGEEVYLYEPGGAVAARFKAKSRRMDGTLSKTGAPITLSK